MQIGFANTFVYIQKLSHHGNCQCIEQSRLDWHHWFQAGVPLEPGDTKM